MKHAFLLSTAAAACMALAGSVWAEPSNQPAGDSQAQHSDHQAKGSPAAANTGRGASAQHGPQTMPQGARSWTGAATRSPLNDAATAQ
jgi:hypothetical protein